MSQAQPVRFVDFFGVAAIQSVLMLGLVWLETGRNFGWPDVAFAIFAGIILTSGIFIIISSVRRHRAADAPKFQIPSRFFPRLVVYLCVFMLIYAIPLVDIYFLHPTNAQPRMVAEALIRSVWMALGFAIINRWSSAGGPPSSMVKLDLDIKSEHKD